MTDMKCETCKYWCDYVGCDDGLADLNYGDCRRYPAVFGPRKVSEPTAAGRWPLTRRRDWCGEWTERTEDTPQTTTANLKGRNDRA